MTTENLLQYIRRHRFFGEKSITISPDQVFVAGSWAQNEILSQLTILERIVNLVLISGQERYQFGPQTITGATATSPIVLTITAHPFNTGDSVAVGEVEGLTGANGYWPAVTKVDANHISLDGSTGSGIYTDDTGRVYHGLASAVEVRLVSRKETPFGVIPRKLLESVSDERGYYSDTDVTSSEVNSHYVIYDDPIVLGFRGTPGSELKTELIVQRKPLPIETLSATVDPILPVQFDKLLYRGTLFQALELLDLPEADPTLAKAQAMYQEEKDRVSAILASTRRAKRNNTNGFNW